MDVIKRDGTVQQYNFSKVVEAVRKAFMSVVNKNKNLTDEEIVKAKEEVNAEIDDFISILLDVFEEEIHAKKLDNVNIESIQDLIQKTLIKENKYDVVESFIKYRKKREEIREEKSDLIKQIEEKLSGKNIQNQNANLDEASFGGRVGEMASIVCKSRALKKMRKQSRLNHEKNEVYIHDLDSWEDGRHNCLTIPFDKLLSEGFKTRQTDIRPASSVSSAMQLVAVIFQLQSLQQFGGVSASHIDWTMVPYVRKSFRKLYIFEWIKEQEDFYKFDFINSDYDVINKWITNKVTDFYVNFNYTDDDFKFNSETLDKALKQKALFCTQREVYQSVEAMYHNLNTLQSRSGNQLPFTSINYGTCTEPEGRLVIRALLEVSMKGLGKKGVTSIFPCGIFQYMKRVNDKPGTPNYDLKRLALKSTSMRIYPNYANVDWSGNEGYDRKDPKTYFSTMGCRTANGYDINAEEGQNPQLKDGRGNICPVTIILPTLAVLAKEKAYKKFVKLKSNNKDLTDKELKQLYISEFIKLLDKKIYEAKDTLIERFNHICSQSPSSAKFMYENGTMFGYHKEEGIISALKHGTLAIGQLGLAEALLILFGFDHTTEEGMEYAKQIEGLYKQRCIEFKRELKLNFGVYYTPAENLCFTAMKNFKKRFKDFEQEYVTYFIDEDGNKVDKNYFTNSMHVPVWKDVDAFKKIDIESQLTGYSSAGCITYVELPSKCHQNIDAIEEVVDYMMSHDIPYGAINIPLNRCHDCGEPIHDETATECPHCSCDKIERLGRITGYLSTTIENFNSGKQAEFNDRVDHFKN